MRILDSHIAVSVFVCVDEEIEPGQWTRIPKATAFLTVIRGEPFWNGYIVTAAHVIESAGDRNLYLRTDTDEGFDDIEIRREEWFTHYRADVAIVRVKWTGERPYKLYSIYPEQFVRADFSLQMPGPQVADASGIEQNMGPIIQPAIQVCAGDQISMVGLFVEHYGRSKNLPIVRTGTIARMPSVPVRYRHAGGTYSEQVAYLVELHSHSGFSGSPVYVHRRVVSLTQIDVPLVGQADQAGSGKMWVQNPEAEIINFLGLLSGHFDIAETAETTGDIDGTVTVAINAGIATVTPPRQLESFCGGMMSWKIVYRVMKLRGRRETKACHGFLKSELSFITRHHD
jgi:hypothetical protein